MRVRLWKLELQSLPMRQAGSGRQSPQLPLATDGVPPAKFVWDATVM